MNAAKPVTSGSIPDAFVDWLEGLGIELERYPKTGHLKLDKKTLEEYKDMYAEVAPAISLRNALSDLHTQQAYCWPRRVQPGVAGAVRLDYWPVSAEQF